MSEFVTVEFNILVVAEKYQTGIEREDVIMKVVLKSLRNLGGISGRKIKKGYL